MPGILPGPRGAGSPAVRWPGRARCCDPSISASRTHELAREPRSWRHRVDMAVQAEAGGDQHSRGRPVRPRPAVAAAQELLRGGVEPLRPRPPAGDAGRLRPDRAAVRGRAWHGFDALRGVGFSLCRVVRDESELLSIGVAATYRRRGVAGYLLRASMERARVIGARQMFLEVAVDNVAAQQLYLEHGFERVGTRPDYYQRPTATAPPPTPCAAPLMTQGGWNGHPAA